MMPLAPTPVVPVPAKPKIGFSIDSIVGGEGPKSDRDTPSSDRPSPSPPPVSQAPVTVVRPLPSSRSPAVSPILRPSVSIAGSSFNLDSLHHAGHKNPFHGPSEMLPHLGPAGLAAAAAAAGLAASLPHHLGVGMPGMPGMGAAGMPSHPGHIPAMFLPGGMGPVPSQLPRDTYPLYPWLLSRHGRIFPHRFPPGPELPGFLLQPFRKPKRIRTAFSPSQLLKLEHAFEKNHYVVGAERKQLAQALSLTETQVKVWFQNRRTKHKRMQQEEEAKAQSTSGGSPTPKSGDSSPHHNPKWKQEGGSSGSMEHDSKEDLRDHDSSSSGTDT